MADAAGGVRRSVGQDGPSQQSLGDRGAEQVRDPRDLVASIEGSLPDQYRDSPSSV